MDAELSDKVKEILSDPALDNQEILGWLSSLDPAEGEMLDFLAEISRMED